MTPPDVSLLHEMTIEEAIKASENNWQVPADWPVFFDSRQGFWNIRIGVPARLSQGIPLRPYRTAAAGGRLDDADIRRLFPRVVAERVLTVLSYTQAHFTEEKRRARERMFPPPTVEAATPRKRGRKRFG